MHETPESETENANPLADLDEWEEDLRRRYPEPDANEEDRKFRDYDADARPSVREDRKSTRLNSSHVVISYAVFCLKKKKIEF